MHQYNSERALAKIVRQICATREIKLTVFSDDWVFDLQYGKRSGRIFGYDFDLNPAAAKQIAKDKSATSDLLHAHGIPRVEHRLFHGPQLVGYVPMSGNWPAMMEYFASCRHDVVCKPNEGTGGRGVLRARTQLALELAVQKLFTISRSIALSPYEPFETEYRIGVIDGQVEFAYRKERQQLLGDGHSTIRDLLLAHFKKTGNLFLQPDVAADFTESERDDTRVPTPGEVITVNWRHNLGQGALPAMLDRTSEKSKKLNHLAAEALRAIGTRVASVDIVEINGSLKILEINAGIMMESFVKWVPDGWRIATEFYDKIICAMLEIPRT